ncbi:MAG: nucleotidyltransferase family protein, partial [Actinomycetota bacterium]|nr:nucleotidyltransferase family protein [Actinomycetota bacterium]
AVPELLGSLKKAAAALRDAGVPYAVGGGFACWARGGPVDAHDVDLLIRPQDADRALEAAAAAGMRTERPPEGWLVKAWDGDTMVDLIYAPAGGEVDDDLLARAEELSVGGQPMPVATATDVLASKMLASTDHSLGFEGLLEMARALREQIDWDAVEARTASSPHARGFLHLARELGIVGSS